MLPRYVGMPPPAATIRLFAATLLDYYDATMLLRDYFAMPCRR